MRDRPVQKAYVQVPNGNLYYELTGDGVDAVVLIHGNAGDRRHWDAQVPALADHLRVIRYDVRGFGKSSIPAGSSPYADHQDLQLLLDHLGIASAHIVGWSMGSGIAVDFAVTYPSRLKSLVSVGPWVFGYLSPSVQSFFTDLESVAEAIQQGGAKVAVDAWMAAPFFSATIRDASAGGRFRRTAADYSWWAMTNPSQRGSVEPGAMTQLSTIDVPALILTAEYDIPACREIADLLDVAIPDSTKVVMPGTGHLMHMERPQEFNAHLVSFLLMAR